MGRAIVIPQQARTAPGGGRVRTVIQATCGRGRRAGRITGARRPRRRQRRHMAAGAAPERPNGVSGWVNSNLVQLARTPGGSTSRCKRVQSRCFAKGVPWTRGAPWIGKPSTPTPPGLYAIYERAPQPSPDDFLGTWVLPLPRSRPYCTTLTAARERSRSTGAAAPACSTRSAAAVPRLHPDRQQRGRRARPPRGRRHTGRDPLSARSDLRTPVAAGLTLSVCQLS